MDQAPRQRRPRTKRFRQSGPSVRDPLDIDGEMDLWRSVLRVAFQDAEDDTLAGADARTFLKGAVRAGEHVSDLELICDMLGIEASWVQRLATAWIAKRSSVEEHDRPRRGRPPHVWAAQGLVGLVGEAWQGHDAPREEGKEGEEGLDRHRNEKTERDAHEALGGAREAKARQGVTRSGVGDSRSLGQLLTEATQDRRKASLLAALMPMALLPRRAVPGL